VIVAVLVGLLIGCAPKPAEEEVPIKIGLLTDYTGTNSTAGTPEIRGARHVLDDYGWEVAGRRILLIDEDSAYDSTITLDKARKLVEQDKVDVIIGPISTTATEGLTEYLKPSGIPNIAIMEHNEALRGRTIMPNGTDQAVGGIAAVYCYDKLGFRTATVIGVEWLFVQLYVEGFEQIFEAKGGTILQTTFTPWTLDFSSYLATLNKEADFVFFMFQPMMTASFIKQYREYGLTMPLWIGDMGGMEPLLPQLGDLGVGLLGQLHYNLYADTELNKKFVSTFKAKYGVDPDTFAADTYSSILLFLKAVEATGGDTTPAKLRDAFGKLTMVGPKGTCEMRPDYTGVPDRYMARVVKQDGEYIYTVDMMLKGLPVEELLELELK